MAAIQLGLDTFGDVTVGPDGRPKSQAQVIRDTVEEGVAAEAAGVDAFGLGEHHRDDFAISAPEIVLAAIAARTSRIRLGSAVTVLSSDDPIRVFQRFSTLDALSNGRAEVIVGRGSFTESFPLFGLPLSHYEILFEEKLDLLVKLLDDGPVDWTGSIRPPMKGQRVFPPVEGGRRLAVSVGVGGSPESVVRAARHGLPLTLAIIGGAPARFRPYVDLYERALVEMGRSPLPVAVHSPGFVAETDEEAREVFFASYKPMHDRIGGERGWPELTREAFLREVEHGAMHLGGPETVARKIAATAKALGLARFDLKYSAGPLPHEAALKAIDLYGRRVAPMVRDLLA